MKPQWKTWTPYAVFILISLVAGGLSAIFVAKGMPAYQQLAKPVLTPPPLAFPIVWSLLYVLMGTGAARVWKTKAPGREGALLLFSGQLVLNFFWSVWFFGLQAHLFAFVWLLALIAAIALMALAFYEADHIAGWLQLPYLLWSAFAAYLNFAIWLLNR